MTLVKRKKWLNNSNRTTESTLSSDSISVSTNTSSISDSQLSSTSSVAESQSTISDEQTKPVRHLFLVRHGQYQRKRTQSDGHLTEIGEKQATYAADFLSSQLPDNVLFDSLTHSDSKRVSYRVVVRRAIGCHFSDSDTRNSSHHLQTVEIVEQNWHRLFFHRHRFSRTQPFAQFHSRRWMERAWRTETHLFL